MRLVHVALAALLLATPPAVAQTADAVNEVLGNIFGDPAKFEAAFDACRRRWPTHAEAVAALAAYPLVVRVGSGARSARPRTSSRSTIRS